MGSRINFEVFQQKAENAISVLQRNKSAALQAFTQKGERMISAFFDRCKASLDSEGLCSVSQMQSERDRAVAIFQKGLHQFLSLVPENDAELIKRDFVGLVEFSRKLQGRVNAFEKKALVTDDSEWDTIGDDWTMIGDTELLY